MVAIVNSNTLANDPTNAQQAVVQGIQPPAQPQATPPPPVAAPVPPAATAAQATSGIAPVSSVDTGQDLPGLQDAGVASRVTALTSQDSPLMKQARTAGLQAANARGVLNSSIGIGASENAAYSAALPIAQQEAAQAQQSNQQRYDLAAQMARLRAQAGFESQARAENYGYTAALNTNSYAYQAQQQRNQQQFERDMAQISQGNAVDMANLQATLQSKLQSQASNEQLQRMNADFGHQLSLQNSAAQNTLTQIAAQGDQQLKLQANQFAEAMKELQLTLNEQNSVAMANAAVNLFQAEAAIRSSLLGNENIPAAERAAYEQQISALTGPTRNYISAVLGYVPGGQTSTQPVTTNGGTGIAPSGSSAPVLTGGGGQYSGSASV